MCLLGSVFVTGPVVGLEEAHRGVSLLDRKAGSCGLRPGDDVKLTRVCQMQGNRRISLHPDGLWGGLTLGDHTDSAAL